MATAREIINKDGMVVVGVDHAAAIRNPHARRAQDARGNDTAVVMHGNPAYGYITTAELRALQSAERLTPAQWAREKLGDSWTRSDDKE